jgi:2-methylisocitrate lyase-like PEP mutase family enzyme
VAAIHLEDQEWPKKCGHFTGKKLIGPDEMVSKIHAALDSRQNADFLIIARTDAIAVEGFASAIMRGKKYEQAGADLLFFDSPTALQQVVDIPGNFKTPVLINMDFLGQTPWLSRDELENYGFRIAIYPGIPQFSALKASRDIMDELFQTGTIRNLADLRAIGTEFSRLTQQDQASNWEKKYGF